MNAKSPVIVTGANARLGFALASALSEFGYPVVAVYRQDIGRLKELVGATLIQADLADASDRSRLIDLVKSEFSSLRGIIHNASAWLDDGVDNLRLMHAIHVEAPFHLNSELEKLLLASGTKSDIIHVADDSSLRGSKNHIAYAATKAAMANLTLSFAKSMAPSICVNTVAPGFLLAPVGSTDQYIAEAKAKGLIEAQPGSSPLIEAVMYLLASRYTTGSTLSINGGRHLK